VWPFGEIYFTDREKKCGRTFLLRIEPEILRKEEEAFGKICVGVICLLCVCREFFSQFEF
jgi:hypothetical protein